MLHILVLSLHYNFATLTSNSSGQWLQKLVDEKLCLTYRDGQSTYSLRYPHCLFFLELLQNVNFRNAMAHPANKELAHRQQFYFWKNYRNNRLKHILPKPLPESSVGANPASAAPPALPPTTIPAAASGIPPAPPQAPSPMQYGMCAGSTFVKNDQKSSGVERRKRR
ncbi:mediator of RNA polymerase II transcription subunit 31-like isoform X2 [Salvia miltiorrhiza]|uniref:mediator of RNA polymerase II transcription subunit 31-like isoform X2 n=1 Tax=Salvia miltiorrhiza TaxID=226208 RepID=UPI0025AC21EF|nr:mediator of RNA polymerase II transcription subunit 31-like isoform X2 [Salvia miltiorrhiza]